MEPTPTARGNKNRWAVATGLAVAVRRLCGLGARFVRCPDSRENYGGKQLPRITPPRGHRAAVPRPELDGPEAGDHGDSTPPHRMAGEQKRLEEGNRKVKRPKLSTTRRRLGSDRSETGRGGGR